MVSITATIAMPDTIRELFQLKQTVVTISAYEKGHIEAAKRSIREQRSYLEEFIQKDPFFALTLEPYDLQGEDAPDIVRQMIDAAKIFGVGPMAAVAGVIAKLAAEAMIEEGASFAIVDNGGDLSVLNDRPVIVGIYAGASPISNVAFEIPARTRTLGIATSSGTVGPSISFGCADAATVISEDPCLADAAATALGNAVAADNPLEECFRAIDKPGVDGALVIRKDRLALWGSLPKLRRAQMRPDLITRA